MASPTPHVRPSLSTWLCARRNMLGAALARLEVRRGIVLTLTLITILTGPGGLLTTLPVAHAQISPAASSGKPNRFDPTTDARSIIHLPQTGTSDPTWKPSPPQPITRPFLPSMQPGTLTLTPGQAATFLGSDGRLEVDVPGTAVTTSDRAAAGGTLTLQITEIAAPAGSSAGGWGVVSLGTYLLQIVDSAGKEAVSGFHAPLTLKLHYHGREGAFDLTHAFVVLNGGVPQGTKVATPAGASKPTFGAGSTQATTLDSASQTLAVAPTLLTASSSISWDTFAPVSTFGKPDPFNVGLNAGALTTGFPIDVPAGPGGLTPPVNLGYSSESVAEQHSVQGAAPWVGEGWSLGLGSISWSEHNATSSSGTATWEDTWQLSDPFGTSAQLIPPTVTVTTYYDDTPNAITPSPVTWHTSPETHAKIISYVGPNHLSGMTAVPPCFRVFLPNGIMEEFGCTVDSLEYYAQPSGANAGLDYLSNWMLDLITDRNGNQIHITYQRDMVTVNGHTFPRDAQLATIEYDSPGCHNAQTACTGSAWAPQMRVNFVASHHPTRLTGGSSSGCNTGSNLRCDDPLDLSGSGGLAAPSVQTTFVLNDIQVQVRSTGTGSWNTLRDYQLSYEQSGPTTILDPMTNKSESVAGMLDLTQIQEIGDAQSYEAESSANTLAGGALVAACGGCSGGEKVGYVGNGGTLQFNQVNVPSAGTYALTIAYLNGGTDRSATLSVNGGSPSTLAFPGANDNNWSTHVQTLVVSVQLQAGTNTLLFANPSGPAPDVDRITLTPYSASYEAEASVNTLAGGAITVSCAPCSGGEKVGYVGNGGTLQFNQVNVPSAGTYTLTIYYLNGDPGRSATLSINGGSPTTLTFPGGGDNTWLGNIQALALPVQLQAGNNTLLFANPSGPAPDVDRITLQPGGVNTAFPTRIFSYTSQTQYYEDDAYTAPAGNCGGSKMPWNTGCLMWNVSYDGNSRYLSTADNGLGLHQIFSYANARNNTHGVNGGGSNTLDPLYCNSHQTGYPCNQADDQNWSHIVLTQQQDQVVRLTQDGQGGTQTNTTVESTTAYSYQLTAYTATPCSDCTQGMYWGNQNDADYLDYYNGTFMGFAQTTVNLPDGTPTQHGSVDVHKYYTTLGWGIYNTSKVTCYTNPPNPCHNDPWWDYHNAEHGREYEVDHYDVDGTTLLSKTQTQYQLTCPPSGVSGSGSSYGGFDGNLVSELDHNNPVADCDIQTKQVDTYTYDGSTAGGVPHQTVTYAYDSYGRQTSQTVTSNDGGATGSPTTIITKTVYVWDDAVSATSTSATGTYLINFPAFTDTEDTSGNRYSCAYTSYSGLPWETGSQSNLSSSRQLVTRVDQYTNCGTLANSFNDKSGLIETTYNGYDAYGNPLTTRDPDANAGDTAHEGCTESGNLYTTCTTYETTYNTLPISTSNALNQTASIGYTQNAGGGFGLWPTSTTDVNGQISTMTYDGLGRMTSRTLPGETTGLTTSSWTYTSWCSATGAQSPCVEIDTTQRLNDATTITTRAFYDGFGRLVEVRSPGPNGQDVVSFRYYDPSGRDIVDSIEYFVPAYTGSPGTAAYSIPDSTQPVNTTTYVNLRSTTATDALSHSATVTLSVVCNAPGTGDSACYEQALAIDPLNHQSGALTDAFGRETYNQRYTGNSPSTYTVYTTTKDTYDFNENLVQILYPDGVNKTTFQYDAASDLVGMTDPDRGTESYSYDPNGNLTQFVDARGTAGTTFIGYDGLDRQIWRNTTNSPSGAYVTYSYDSTASGNHGIGYLTGETFTNGTLSGSYNFGYDQRGQQTSETETVGSTSYPIQATYDDAGAMLTKTYPDGEVVTNSYTAQDWLSGVTLQTGSSAVTLLSNATYSGTGGSGGLMTGASLDGGTYQYTATYDLLLRLTDTKLTRVSNGATLFEVGQTFDAAGNVSTITTTLPQGTDQQQFCYDEQNRLTWAGSVGTPPCTGTAITPGSLTSAEYTQSFAYDTLDRLTSGPQGTYAYGDSHHLHAVTSISSYTATYDAAGNMTCRAPTNASTCTGSSPTGAQLSYDNEGRLTHWQNTPSNPTTTVNYLYDGAGKRIAQQVTGSTTTTIVYVGSLEEVATSGSTTTTTTYYYAAGRLIALAVNGVFSYLGNDRLSSVTVALDASGNLQASQLHAPYGGVRYSNGMVPGTYGFTGQRADGATGLDYYNARYYDPVSGLFTSADTALPGDGFATIGLNRYAYVGDNPETYVDPTGNFPFLLNIPPWLIRLVFNIAFGLFRLWVQLVGAFNPNWGDPNAWGGEPLPPIIHNPPQPPGINGPGGDDGESGGGIRRRPPRGPGGLPPPGSITPIVTPGAPWHKIARNNPTFPRPTPPPDQQTSTDQQTSPGRVVHPPMKPHAPYNPYWDNPRFQQANDLGTSQYADNPYDTNWRFQQANAPDPIQPPATPTPAPPSPPWWSLPGQWWCGGSPPYHCVIL